MGLTVACAQCHDHKFDPIPTRDFDALQRVFNNTKLHEYPLVSDSEVEAFAKAKNRYDEQNTAVNAVLNRRAAELSEVLANRTSDYIRAAYQVLGRPSFPQPMSKGMLSTALSLKRRANRGS